MPLYSSVSNLLDACHGSEDCILYISRGWGFREDNSPHGDGDREKLSPVCIGGDGEKLSPRDRHGGHSQREIPVAISSLCPCPMARMSLCDLRGRDPWVTAQKPSTIGNDRDCCFWWLAGRPGSGKLTRPGGQRPSNQAWWIRPSGVRLRQPCRHRKRRDELSCDAGIFRPLVVHRREAMATHKPCERA